MFLKSLQTVLMCLRYFSVRVFRKLSVFRSVLFVTFVAKRSVAKRMHASDLWRCCGFGLIKADVTPAFTVGTTVKVTKRCCLTWKDELKLNFQGDVCCCVLKRLFSSSKWHLSTSHLIALLLKRRRPPVVCMLSLSPSSNQAPPSLPHW